MTRVGRAAGYWNAGNDLMSRAQAESGCGEARS
jgi:hypothetical protein